jgi:hypothetical protein
MTRREISASLRYGTAVAGIIGATAFNHKGGRGVAYNAAFWIQPPGFAVSPIGEVLGAIRFRRQ